MARQVRFALYLKDEHEVRNSIEEIREYFDYSKVVAYVIDGRLQSWLSRRGYDEEADAIGKLNVEDGNFKEQLFAILGVDAEVTDEDESVVDANLVARLEYVKQYTADENVLQNIGKVATNQKELLELVKNNEPEIYLCKGDFAIPLVVENVKYIGIAGPTAIIRSSKPVNFTESNIIFENVNFNDEYLRLCEEVIAKEENNISDEDKSVDIFIEALEYYEDDDDKYIELMKKSAELGNAEAMFRIGFYYEDEENFIEARRWYNKAIKNGYDTGLIRMGHICCNEEDYTNAEKYYKRAAEKGDAYGMYYLGYFYEYYQYDEKKGVKWYRKAADAGHEDGMIRIGRYEREHKHHKEALAWFTKVIDNNNDNGEALNQIGLMYGNGEGVKDNAQIAFSYYEKSAQAGYDWGMYNLAQCYENGDGVIKNLDKALEWYEKSAEAGNEEAKNRLSENTVTTQKSKTYLRKTDIIAELLGVLINGKLKNGTFLWKTDGDEEIKRYNFPYRKWRDEAVRKFFEHYKGSSDCVIGGLRETNILTSDEYLIFKDYCLIIRDYSGKIIQIKYCDIENVSIEGEYNNKLMYKTKGGDKRELEGNRSYLWKEYAGLYGIRLFLLVMGKICGDCKYQFNDDEITRLSKIRLETLDGDSVLDYL